MSILIDTSALFALLDRDDANHRAAVAWWTSSEDDLVAHAYVVTEALALVRRRLGRAAVVALIDDMLPALRVEMVDRPTHEEALAAFRAEGGGTSFVDRVSIAFARRSGIESAFAFDADLAAAGLAFPS